MRLKASTLSRLVSFLLGFAWAIALVGAVSTFLSFFPLNPIVAVFFAVIGAVPGLLIVVFLEYLLLKSEKLAELKKQTKLLEVLTQSSR